MSGKTGNKKEVYDALALGSERNISLLPPIMTNS
jgi:hypothetical protein